MSIQVTYLLARIRANQPRLALSTLLYQDHSVVNAARQGSYLYPNSLHSYCPFSVTKMALEKEQASTDLSKHNKDSILDSKEEPGRNVDLEASKERQDKTKYGHSDRSVGARIAPVLPHLRAYDFGSDDSESDILGKQLELEAGNDIQYRTCSWQKVCITSWRFGPSFNV